MRHDTSTNMDNFKKDFDYLKIDKTLAKVSISLYGNIDSDQIAAVTTYISQYFGPATELSFDLDFDMHAQKGCFNISWS